MVITDSLEEYNTNPSSMVAAVQGPVSQRGAGGPGRGQDIKKDLIQAVQSGERALLGLDQRNSQRPTSGTRSAWAAGASSRE